MIFYLDERHSVKATGLERGKKSINWVSVGNFETLRQLYSKTYSPQIFHRQGLHIKVIPSTV